MEQPGGVNAKGARDAKGTQAPNGKEGGQKIAGRPAAKRFYAESCAVHEANRTVHTAGTPIVPCPCPGAPSAIDIPLSKSYPKQVELIHNMHKACLK